MGIAMYANVMDNVIRAGGVRRTGAGGALPADPDVDSSRGAMPAPQGAFARWAFYLADPSTPS